MGELYPFMQMITMEKVKWHASGSKIDAEHWIDYNR